MSEITRSKEFRMAAIGIVVIVISGLMWVVPPAEVEVENSLHHLNFIPILLSAVLLSWGGAALTTLATAIAQSPYILISQRVSPENALDQVVELSIFGVAGVFAGFLSDRERRQKVELESASAELQRVYGELQANVDQLRRSERLYAAGQLAASLAHEIRNPLEGISGAASLLRRGKVSGENFRDCLDIIELESQRLNKLLTGFLEFARPRAPRFQPADIGLLIDSVRLLVAQSPLARSTPVAAVVPEGMSEVECDPEQLKQVLLNLVLNAVEASPPNSEVTIAADRVDGHVRISVTDKGAGVTPGDEDKIFEPFFTTREKGSGLGLAIASNIVRQHGGNLAAENNPAGGMTFRVELPVHQEVTQ
ncbi:MAG: Sensor histidine kinase [Bryobacterales bacterium]|nr:Sensor histidine kinase [Bryobacterales bacterium]